MQLVILHTICDNNYNYPAKGACCAAGVELCCAKLPNPKVFWFARLANEEFCCCPTVPNDEAIKKHQQNLSSVIKMHDNLHIQWGVKK